MQEKQDQKVVLVSLSIHINFEHEEHTQKKIKPRPTYLDLLWLRHLCYRSPRPR